MFVRALALVLLALVSMPVARVARATPGDYTGSSLAAVGDIDNDGYADYLVGSPGAMSAKGRVDVYFGTAVSGPELRTTLNSNEFSTAFGRAVAGIGDVNGDYYDDVAIGQPLYAGAGVANGGRVWIYLGGPDGLTPGAGIPIAGTVNQGQFGSSLAGAGDVNGDGYADLLVGAPYAQRAGGGVPASHGEAYLFYGSASGIDAANPVVLSGTATRQYRGYAVSSAGDIDGDQYADVAVGAPGEETDFIQGRIYLYRGSAAGLIAMPAESLAAGSRSGRFGAAIALVGDRDGDTRRDLVIGSPNDSAGPAVEAGRVFLRRTGGPGEVTTLRDGSQAGAHLGAAVAAGGDFDGDLREEVLLGEPDWDGAISIDEGRAHLLYGAGDSIRVFDSTVAFSQFGFAVAGVGDVDRDFDDDLLFGAPGTPEGGAVTLVLSQADEVDGGPGPDPLIAFIAPPFPNPAVGAGQAVHFHCTLPFVESASRFEFKIHDVRGRHVRFLLQGTFRGPGRMDLFWDGRDDAGRPVQPGVYFARLTAGGKVATQDVVRLP